MKIVQANNYPDFFYNFFPSPILLIVLVVTCKKERQIIYSNIVDPLKFISMSHIWFDLCSERNNKKMNVFRLY